MRNAPPVADLVHTLALFGVNVRPEIVPALLSWSGVIGAAVVAGWFGLAKIRTDKRSISMPELWDKVVAQGEAIEGLRRDMGELRSENRHLRDVVRDRDETLKDYAAHVLNRDQADASDGALPTPVKSWRILEHLKDYQAWKERV